MLSDKVSGDLAGVWLLVAEHLRLGTWDLLCGWTKQPSERAEPRLALQMVHEAAVCTTGIRSERTLHKRAGFELVNGLPFVAADTTIHQLLSERAVDDSQQLQIALGKLRLASGHFQGHLLAIDPHRVRSHSRRQMRERIEKGGQIPTKMAQTFWALDADTHQPVCFTSATSARGVGKATPELLDLAGEILRPLNVHTLVLADAEHFAGNLLQDVRQRPRFDLLVPIPNQPSYRKKFAMIPEDQFIRRWKASAFLPCNASTPVHPHQVLGVHTVFGRKARNAGQIFQVALGNNSSNGNVETQSAQLAQPSGCGRKTSFAAYGIVYLRR